VTSVTFAWGNTRVEDAPVEAFIAAIVLVLLVGAFVGNLYASKRRPAPRVSVYDTIRRRLEAERASGSDQER
jgi:hypothetical protein